MHTRKISLLLIIDIITITPVGPSELVVYAIWQEILNAEEAEYQQTNGNCPLLPAISRGKRHLLSTAFASYLFDSPATPSQVCNYERLCRV